MGGNARIVDFGLATVARDPNSPPSTPVRHGHTLRFTAPEILRGEKPHSKESDVFAFGMVMIEVGDLVFILVKSPDRFIKVFTGRVPFSDCAAVPAMVKIMTGYRPERPIHPGFTDDLWTLAQRCWEVNPQDRPQVGSIIEQLSVFLQNQRENTLFIKSTEIPTKLYT